MSPLVEAVESSWITMLVDFTVGKSSDTSNRPIIRLGRLSDNTEAFDDGCGEEIVRTALLPGLADLLLKHEDDD